MPVLDAVLEAAAWNEPVTPAAEDELLATTPATAPAATTATITSTATPNTQGVMPRIFLRRELPSCLPCSRRSSRLLVSVGGPRGVAWLDMSVFVVYSMLSCLCVLNAFLSNYGCMCIELTRLVSTRAVIGSML